MNQPARWGTVFLASMLTFVLTACLGQDAAPRHIPVIGTDGNTGQEFSDNFSADPGALIGMRGVTPLTELSAEFRGRLLELAPDLKDLNYSAESYDAVIVTALAAELARSYSGPEIARFINGVTTRGDKCGSFVECKKLIDEGVDIDYDGMSGVLEFTNPGEPSVASFGVVKHERGNENIGYNRVSTDVEYDTVGDATRAADAQVAPAPRDQAVAGAGLKFGALLSQTGPLAHTGPPMIAAVRLAINDLNEVGVNGAAVSVVERDDATDPTVAGSAAQSLLQAGVQVIIGCAGSASSLATIDAITGAGVVMFSPSNTSDQFTSYPDAGLYFRTAPPDVLQACALAGLIREESGGRVAILYQETAYGGGLANNLGKELAATGISADAVLLIGYDPAARDFQGQVEKAKEHHPDHIVVIGYDESKLVIRALNRQSIGPKR